MAICSDQPREGVVMMVIVVQAVIMIAGDVV